MFRVFRLPATSIKSDMIVIQTKTFPFVILVTDALNCQIVGKANSGYDRITRVVAESSRQQILAVLVEAFLHLRRSEERRVGKECRL